MAELFNDKQLFNLYNMGEKDGLFSGKVIQRLVKEIIGYREKLKELTAISDIDKLKEELERVKCHLSR